MPYTANKRYSVQAASSNSGTWGAGGTAGDDLNTGVMGLVDTQLAQPVTFSVSASNVTLSYAQVQSCFYSFTGALLAGITVSPDTGGSPIAASFFNGFYFFSNTTSGNFAITLQNASGSVVLPQGRRGIVYANTANSIAPIIVAIVGATNPQIFPAGTVQPFYQNAAPTGWTIVSSLNDYGLRIVSSGGGVTSGGSVAYSALFARTTTDGHALIEAENGPHRHFLFSAETISSATGPTSTTQAAQANSIGNNTSYQMASTNTDATVGRTSSSGSGTAHTHPLDMRVQTADFIIATLG